ncbi:MAG: hypothetical protein DLM67_00460 [Candidatus Nephthysia bennettiae]|nr:MAG: hypothetical protein DLM67_00460 [Candidatus Dormibacteraeota bacterium]
MCELRASVRAVQLTYAIVFLIGITIAAVVATTLMNNTVARELLAVAMSAWAILQSCEHFMLSSLGSASSRSVTASAPPAR